MWRHGEPTVRQLAFMLLQKLAGQPATLYRCELLACVCVHVCVHTVYRHIVVKLRDSGRISQRKCMPGPYLCVSCRLAAGNNCAARCLVMPAAFVLSPPLHHKAPVCVQYSTSAHSRPPPAASNRMSRGNPQRVLRTIPRVPRVKGRGGYCPFLLRFLLCCRFPRLCHTPRAREEEEEDVEAQAGPAATLTAGGAVTHPGSKQQTGAAGAARPAHSGGGSLSGRTGAMGAPSARPAASGEWPLFFRGIGGLGIRGR